jgi:exodeoxyribonuclease V alpha subunit
VSATAQPPLLDEFDARRAGQASGLLRAFNEVGLLAAVDVQVATRMARLVGEEREAVQLAVALAVRGPRLGHVFVDLATIRETASVESDEPVDLSTLPWPAVATWVAEVGSSDLVAVGDDDARGDRPLRLLGSELYLDRYWREERRVAADLTELAGSKPDDVDVDLLTDGVARLSTGDRDERQRLAAAAAISNRFAVIAGGPGTGKTTTVARIVALVAEQAQAAGRRPPLVALAAPTGKAAARLQEAVHDEAAKLAIDDATRGLLLGLRASTLHRLLGWRPGSHSRFRHDRGRRLPHDVVVVDETSMVSLWLMARLVEAIRPDARLILVGDPGQLASIEAGAVLGDVVGPAADGPRIGPRTRERLASVTGHPVAAEDPPPAAAIADGIVVLDRVHRYGEGIAALAEAIRRGDADGALDVLARGPAGVTWLAPQEAEHAIRAGVLEAARGVRDAARHGAAREAIAALGGFRLLCAHRRGRDGVAAWTARVEDWLDVRADEPWYAGRPLLVTENDYELRLYNGDTGVVVEGDGRLVAAFERAGDIVEVSPTRLSAIDTAYAMTIHKSQGSQFHTAAVLLPEPGARILTRELLYTAATRARERLILAGSEEAIRAAISRPIARASGLRARLWGA